MLNRIVRANVRSVQGVTVWEDSQRIARFGEPLAEPHFLCLQGGGAQAFFSPLQGRNDFTEFGGGYLSTLGAGHFPGGGICDSFYPLIYPRMSPLRRMVLKPLLREIQHVATFGSESFWRDLSFPNEPTGRTIARRRIGLGELFEMKSRIKVSMKAQELIPDSEALYHVPLRLTRIHEIIDLDGNPLPLQKPAYQLARYSSGIPIRVTELLCFPSVREQTGANPDSMIGACRIMGRGLGALHSHLIIQSAPLSINVLVGGQMSDFEGAGQYEDEKGTLFRLRRTLDVYSSVSTLLHYALAVGKNDREKEELFREGERIFHSEYLGRNPSQGQEFLFGEIEKALDERHKMIFEGITVHVAAAVARTAVVPVHEHIGEESVLETKAIDGLAARLKEDIDSIFESRGIDFSFSQTIAEGMIRRSWHFDLVLDDNERIMEKSIVTIRDGIAWLVDRMIERQGKFRRRLFFAAFRMYAMAGFDIDYFQRLAKLICHHDDSDIFFLDPDETPGLRTKLLKLLRIYRKVVEGGIQGKELKETVEQFAAIAFSLTRDKNVFARLFGKERASLERRMVHCMNNVNMAISGDGLYIYPARQGSCVCSVSCSIIGETWFYKSEAKKVMGSVTPIYTGIPGDQLRVFYTPSSKDHEIGHMKHCVCFEDSIPNEGLEDYKELLAQLSSIAHGRLTRRKLNSLLNQVSFGSGKDFEKLLASFKAHLGDPIFGSAVESTMREGRELTLPNLSRKELMRIKQAAKKAEANEFRRKAGFDFQEIEAIFLD